MAIIWNYFYDELMYYLARKFRLDFKHDTKLRLLDLAAVNSLNINLDKPTLDLWYMIIMASANQRKLIKLLQVIMNDDLGEQDEYLAAAILAIESGKMTANKELTSPEWKGGAETKMVKEKIMGKRSNLLPIAFLELGVEAAKSIVRIETDDDTGSGFLIEGGWLMTNNHVIPNANVLNMAFAQFNYQYPKTYRVGTSDIMKVKAEYQIPLYPEAGHENNFFTNELEDWTLIRLDRRWAEGLKPYGVLKLSEKPARVNDFVNIVQHPLGGPKQIGIYNNMVMYADGKILQYMTDTNEGSSGSAVLNSDWEVVGIHHSGGWLTDPENNTAVKRNQGTDISVIKDFITNNIQKA